MRKDIVVVRSRNIRNEFKHMMDQLWRHSPTIVRASRKRERERELRTLGQIIEKKTPKVMMSAVKRIISSKQNRDFFFHPEPF